jgi:dTDP-4-dehydrorhamnose reductase
VSATSRQSHDADSDLNGATRVLVLGATGFLGSSVSLSIADRCVPLLQSRSRMSIPVRAECLVNDLATENAIHSMLRASRPDVVINCVALADVDRCEGDPVEADRLNVQLPRRLATACRSTGAHFVHVSTDAVFGGAEPPYSETSAPSPINEYGRSKARGEAEVLAVNETALVVRTNIVGWSPSGRRSLLEFFVNRLEVNKVTPGFIDVSFRPLSVLRFWPMVCEFLDETTRSGVGGIRHATGSELVTKFDFGRMVADVFGFDRELVVPSSVGDLGLAAPRGSCLDVFPTSLLDGKVSPTLGVLDDLRGLRDAAGRGWRRRIQDFESSDARTLS